MSVSVYPCKCPEGHHLMGYPQFPPVEGLEVSKAEAKWLVATKAFSYDKNGLHTRTETHESATWPPPEAEPVEPEGPANAGPLDSTEV